MYTIGIFLAPNRVFRSKRIEYPSPISAILSIDTQYPFPAKQVMVQGSKLRFLLFNHTSIY
jgi:hypothetical protein